MGTCEKFLCLILWTGAFVLVAHAVRNHGKVLSEEQHLERQLEAINKPAIKSFQTEDGDILDCVDIHKQLAFDHPLLKNHTVQMRPKIIPGWITDNNASQEGDSLQFLPDDIECPDGTVIIKRVTKQDLLNVQRLKYLGFQYPGISGSKSNIGINPAGHHSAVVECRFINSGAKGNINVWDPAVSPDQFSVASMWLVDGHGDQHSCIQAGWMVNRALYPDHGRLYTYWTADGYNKTGCFNTLCPGFVQVSKKMPLGLVVQPVSTYNSSQFLIAVSIYQDLHTGHWWFVLKDEYIGYWPKSLFTASGLASAATFVSWGGEVYSPVAEKSPPMGSGHFAEEGFSKSAFVNGLKLIDDSGSIYNPPGWTTKIYADHPNCYNAKYVKGGDDPWARAVFFGGPGGCTF